MLKVWKLKGTFNFTCRAADISRQKILAFAVCLLKVDNPFSFLWKSETKKQSPQCLPLYFHNAKCIRAALASWWNERRSALLLIIKGLELSNNICSDPKMNKEIKCFSCTSIKGWNWFFMYEESRDADAFSFQVKLIHDALWRSYL